MWINLEAPTKNRTRWGNVIKMIMDPTNGSALSRVRHQKTSRGKYCRKVRFVKVIHNQISVYFSISWNSFVTLRIFSLFYDGWRDVEYGCYLMDRDEALWRKNANQSNHEEHDMKQTQWKRRPPKDRVKVSLLIYPTRSYFFRWQLM